MPDQYTEVTTRGFGKNLMDSVAGVLIGIILFLGSFAVLWWNEGRADLSKLAVQSVPVEPATVSAEHNDKFVSLSGTLKTSENLGDDYLSSGNYLVLNRKVEMYAWTEEVEEKEKDKLGGGTEITTTYTYDKKWTEFTPSSNEFKVPEGHLNPPATLASRTQKVTAASIGAYGIDVARVELPAPTDVVLDPQIVILKDDVRLAGNYLYKFAHASSTPENSEIGDVRISYQALPANAGATAFGKLSGDRLVPYETAQGSLYRIFSGSREEALLTLGTEHTTLLWLLRIAGFLMMWIGLTMIFGPLNTVLKIIPFLGSVGRGITGMVTFPVALILSVLTVVLARVFHNVWILVAVIVAVLILLKVLSGRRKAVAS